MERVLTIDTMNLNLASLANSCKSPIHFLYSTYFYIPIYCHLHDGRHSEMAIDLPELGRIIPGLLENYRWHSLRLVDIKNVVAKGR